MLGFNRKSSTSSSSSCEQKHKARRLKATQRNKARLEQHPHDHKVDGQETHPKLSHQQLLTQNISQIYSKYDTNNTGFLEQKQLIALINSLCEIMHMSMPTEEKIIAAAKEIEDGYAGRVRREKLIGLVGKVCVH